MSNRYDELGSEEKAAVDWEARRIHAVTCTIPDGGGDYARQNADEYVKALKESLASGDCVPQFVKAFQSAQPGPIRAAAEKLPSTPPRKLPTP